MKALKPMNNLIVMVVNKKRYLLNEDAASIDQAAKIILAAYPADAEVYFTHPIPSDYKNSYDQNR